MQIALAACELEMEVSEAAGGDREGGDVALDHRGVEDQASVGSALVRGQELGDRATADLLLAVADKTDIDRQSVLTGERAGRLEQHEELPLVIRAATPVEPAVPLDEREGLRLPELEWIDCLNVEMPVAEHGGRLAPAGGGDLGDDERLPLPADPLGRAARFADLAHEPVAGALDIGGAGRIGAHARDGDPLRQLCQQLSAHASEFTNAPIDRILYRRTPDN